MKYPKIQTLYKRQYTQEECKAKRIKGNPIVEGCYSREEFEIIDKWIVQEKVDGTNIRIFSDGTFAGRTEVSSIPPFLLKRLQHLFPIEKLKSVFGDKEFILYGEGYGNKIQRYGHLYIPKSYVVLQQDFILFDAYINRQWADYNAIASIANEFEIESCPLVFQKSVNKKEIVEYVKSKPKSLLAQKEMIMEGIVAKTYPLMRFKGGEPIYFKLKCEDFK